MTNKKLKIGLIGFGVVGEGIYQVLKNTPSLDAEIVKIGIKNSSKERNAPSELFTNDVQSIINNPNINVIVELIDDDIAAYQIVKQSLLNKKAVVSANKKMIAAHQKELIELQKENNVPLLYEAAVGGSLPIIRNLEEYYDNDLLQSFEGIINGSTNYILGKLQENNLSFSDALSLAQKLGFAESNPHIDVSGEDAVNKLGIILNHAFGIVIDTQQIVRHGITNIKKEDIAFAKEKNYKIKLIANAKIDENQRITASVLPTFIQSNEIFFNIDQENNGIALGSSFSDKQFFSGKGAGRYPTASAVLSDISALRYDYKYEYRKYNAKLENKLVNDCDVKVYVNFNDWQTIDKNCFTTIEETFESKTNKYLIGWLPSESINKESWIQDTSVSLIHFQNN